MRSIGVDCQRAVVSPQREYSGGRALAKCDAAFLGDTGRNFGELRLIGCLDCRCCAGMSFVRAVLVAVAVTASIDAFGT